MLGFLENNTIRTFWFSAGWLPSTPNCTCIPPVMKDFRVSSLLLGGISLWLFNGTIKFDWFGTFRATIFSVNGYYIATADHEHQNALKDKFFHIKLQQTSLTRMPFLKNMLRYIPEYPPATLKLSLCCWWREQAIGAHFLHRLKAWTSLRALIWKVKIALVTRWRRLFYALFQPQVSQPDPEQ